MNKQKEKALAYLKQLLNFGIKLDLDNIRHILAKLGNIHRSNRPYIHIAGTNGKGSVCCMLANALEKSGKKVGLYTSPYLVDITERWRINGKPIKKEKLYKLIFQVKEASNNITPTYFEVLTAVAFLYFTQEKVDIAILETGMGGRLDATNICHPLITAITSINYDHTQYLGDTIQKITQEKAGIIKNNTPIVIGKLTKISLDIIKTKAKKNNAPIIESQNLNIKVHNRANLEQKISIFDNHKKYTTTLKLLGSHQIENFKTTYAILKQLIQLNFISDMQTTLNGVAMTYWVDWAGRIDHINENLVIDGAHNPNATEALVSYLQKISSEKWTVYFNCMNDKDWQAIISLLIPITQQFKLINLDDNPRALDTKIIAKYLKTKKVKYTFSSLCELEESPSEKTLVAGSLYLAGKVYAKLFNQKPLPIKK